MLDERERAECAKEAADIVGEIRKGLEEGAGDKQIAKLFESLLALDEIPTDTDLPAESLAVAVKAAKLGVKGFSLLRFKMRMRRQLGSESPLDAFEHPTPYKLKEEALLLCAKEAAAMTDEKLPEPFDEETADYVGGELLYMLDRTLGPGEKEETADCLPFLLYRLGRMQEAGRLAAQRLVLKESAPMWRLRARLLNDADEKLDALAAAEEIRPGQTQAWAFEEEAARARRTLWAGIPEYRAVFGAYRIGRDGELSVPLALDESGIASAVPLSAEEGLKFDFRPGEPVYVRGMRDAGGRFVILSVRPRPEGAPRDVLRMGLATYAEPIGRFLLRAVGVCSQEVVIPGELLPSGTVLKPGNTIEYAYASGECDGETEIFFARPLSGKAGPSLRRATGVLKPNSRGFHTDDEAFLLRASGGGTIFVSEALANAAGVGAGSRVRAEAAYFRKALRALTLRAAG